MTRIIKKQNYFTMWNLFCTLLLNKTVSLNICVIHFVVKITMFNTYDGIKRALYFYVHVYCTNTFCWSFVPKSLQSILVRNDPEKILMFAYFYAW